MNNYPDDVRCHDKHAGSPWSNDKEQFEALVDECKHKLLIDYKKLEEILFSDESFTRKLVLLYLTSIDGFMEAFDEKVNELAIESAKQQIMSRGK